MYKFSFYYPMSVNKYDTNDDFPFAKLYLANPNGLQGGSYFSKIRIDSDTVLIQMPKCSTKNGIHKTGKKMYTDLLFDKSDAKFETWVETLSDTVKNLIYEKKDIWFQDDLSFDDIEYAWQEILRNYKKKNVLFRCFIKKPKNISRDELIMVYDEDENNLTLDDIKENTQIIPLIQLTGLKFTSHSFSLEFNLKQIMVLKNLSTKPLIKITNTNKKTVSLENDTPLVVHSETQDKDIQPKEPVVDLSNNEDIEDIEDNDEIEDGDDKLKSSNLLKDISNNILDKNPIENLENLENTEPLQTTEIKTSKNSTSTNDIKEISNTLEKNIISELNEIKLELPDTNKSISLKSPQDVYIEIYEEAKRRAKEAKRAAIEAVLEYKRIKNKYMLDELESSDDEFELSDGL